MAETTVAASRPRGLAEIIAIAVGEEGEPS